MPQVKAGFKFRTTKFTIEIFFIRGIVAQKAMTEKVRISQKAQWTGDSANPAQVAFSWNSLPSCVSKRPVLVGYDGVPPSKGNAYASIA